VEPDKKLPENLTEAQQKAIAEGTAFAVPIAKPKISNRLFTIALALLVFAGIAPFSMGGISLLIYFAALFSAGGWMLLAKIYDSQYANIITARHVDAGIFRHIIHEQAELVVKQQDRLKELGELSDD